MVHFCKLCQLLNKSMDYIECDDSNVWLLENVFKLKIVPINGRVEPICQKCIDRYNKVMRRKRKANGGFPISQNEIFPITTTTTVTSSQLVIAGSMMNGVVQQKLQEPQMSLATASQLKDEDAARKASIMTSNSFQLNITGAAAVYRTVGKDEHGSSDEESSAEKSSDVDDEEDDNDGESSDSSDCCSEGSGDSSSSYSTSSSSGESSSETRTSLTLEKWIDEVRSGTTSKVESTDTFPDSFEMSAPVAPDEGTPETSSVEPMQQDDTKPSLDVAEEKPKSTRKQSKRNSDSVDYICQTCEKTFTRAVYLKVHMRTHTGEKPFACEICFKSFTQASSLNTHRRLHTNIRPFTCNVCNAEYNSSGNFKVHMRTHTMEKPYKCSSCDKTFNQLSSKKLHERVHSNEKPYVCQVCLKAFISVSNLYVHSRVHNKERPYPCEQCDKRFSQSQTLKTHVLSKHTDSRPYQCDICPRSYATLSNLKNHKNRHLTVKPFVCDECGSRFTQKSSLKTHILSHRTDKEHRCDKCGKYYSTPGNLATHQKTVNCEKAANPPVVYQCEDCQRTFKMEVRYLNHMRSIHKKDLRNDPPVPSTTAPDTEPPSVVSDSTDSLKEILSDSLDVLSSALVTEFEDHFAAHNF